MNHTVRVVTLGWGHVVHVGVEIRVASEAMMLRVGDVNIARPARNGIAQIVKPANHRPQAMGTPFALRTEPPLVVATLPPDVGLGQILDPRNPFRLIPDVPSWSGHGHILHESASLELSAKPTTNQEEYSVLMLQTLKKVF
jgi:hypothetical protein